MRADGSAGKQICKRIIFVNRECRKYDTTENMLKVFIFLIQDLLGAVDIKTTIL